MCTQEITLTQSSSGGLYTKLLRGRYVTSIDDGTITLDDGTELYIHGNDGCGGCESGWYWLENVYKQGSRRARIMSAYVDYDEDDKEPPSVYTIFVMVDGNPTQLPLATVRGDDGNGYYGTGFTLTATVKPRPAPPTVTPQDIIKAIAGKHPLPPIPDNRGREALLNAVAYTLLQTRGFDSPLRITGPEAQLFHKLTSSRYQQSHGPYYEGQWYGFKQATLFYFTDMEDGVSLVLRDLANGADAYAAKLYAFTQRVRASKNPIKTFVTDYALKGNTATVNGKRVPATDLLLSEVCGFHGDNIDPKGSYIPYHYFFYDAKTYGARILKHREGGRGDVTIYSDSQSVWAINTQKGTRA